MTALLASSSREKEKCLLHAARVEDKEKDNDKDMDKKELRRQIKRWWEGIADHMDALVGILWVNVMW
jgi:1-phosphatidylinositol-3-phosphate 5-kinase